VCVVLCCGTCSYPVFVVIVFVIVFEFVFCANVGLFCLGFVSFAGGVEIPIGVSATVCPDGFVIPVCSGVIGGVHEVLRVSYGLFEFAQGGIAAHVFLHLLSHDGPFDHPFWFASAGVPSFPPSLVFVSVVWSPLQFDACGSHDGAVASVHEFSAGGVHVGVVVESPDGAHLRWE